MNIQIVKQNVKARVVAIVAVSRRGRITKHAMPCHVPSPLQSQLAAHMKMPTQAALGDTSDSQSSTAQKILIDLEVSLGWKRKPVLAAAESLPLLCFLRLS